ncbi:MAG: tetratricopeptide repeat protein [Planctomycetota bacterium]|jgi:tetratricopeptide (TPR) repeat protein
MEQESSLQNQAKAKAFFDRAKQAADKGNFDYAIDMYLEGLRCIPDALQEGHLPLRHLALQRKEKKGKKPSMVEKVKLLQGKDPIDKMINAEYLYAKDPDNLSYAEAMLKATAYGKFHQTALWVADHIFQTNNAAKKPSVKTYILLKNSYAAIGLFDRAIAACQKAAQLKPQDGNLSDELQRLSAELTVSRGRYDQAGDFRNSIKNREAQERLQAQDAIIKSESFRLSELEEAQKAFEQDPNDQKNIFKLVEALVDQQKDASDNEAVQILEKAYQQEKDFSFKQQAGKIKIKNIKRKIREIRGELEKNADDQQLKAQFNKFIAQLNAVELEHYRLCVENYPTDQNVKYEYASRLVKNKKYDEAIPLFQEAKRDIKYKIPAMSKIGLCFFLKGWYADAIDVFKEAIDSYEVQDDGVAKELRYNLGRAYEEKGETEKALETYRKIAQLDFGYKDVRQRVDKLRSAQQ